MKNNLKILSDYEHICLFCGKEIRKRYEDYTPYYECECEDAKKNSEITDKIRQLEMSRPVAKYYIVQKNILYPKK